jgi:hypothetical protein
MRIVSVVIEKCPKCGEPHKLGYTEKLSIPASGKMNDSSHQEEFERIFTCPVKKEEFKVVYTILPAVGQIDAQVIRTEDITYNDLVLRKIGENLFLESMNTRREHCMSMAKITFAS